MNKNIKIGNHIISENSPVFCIGELSCNHLNNYELAMKTIDAMMLEWIVLSCRLLNRIR